MKIKWYYPFEKLGLVKNLTTFYNDGYTHYQVSSKANDIYSYILFSLIPIFIVSGFLIAFFLNKANKPILSKKITLSVFILLVIYAFSLTLGIGPYIQLYPKSAGFIDFSVLEHIISGIYCLFIAVCYLLSSKLGKYIANHKNKNKGV